MNQSPESNRNINLNISPSTNVTVPPHGTSTLLLKAKVKENADIVPVSIPLKVNITIPNIDINYNLNYTDPLDVQPIQTSLNVAIQEPFSPEERWSMFWNVYGGFISFIGAGFAAGFATIIFRKFQKNGGASKADS
jgi:hypothetical protein